MSRIIAIDYGTKRCGIAVSDELQIIANGLKVIDPKDIFSFLELYIKQNNVSEIIVGYPIGMRGQITSTTLIIEDFIRQLKNKFLQLKIEKFDERLTSVMAQKSMLEAGYKKSVRQKKENIDIIAATILLQNYLDLKQLQNTKQ